jgi:non-ribosomal peptide synthetase component F
LAAVPEGRLAVLDLVERTDIASRPWLARYDPGIPATLDYPSLRVDELLGRTAERYADRSALIFFGRHTSYRALDEAVDRLAEGLRRLGLEHGERVALFMPNCPQLVTSSAAQLANTFLSQSVRDPYTIAITKPSSVSIAQTGVS